MQYCVKYFSTKIPLEIVSSRSRVDSTLYRLYPNIRSRVQMLGILCTHVTHTYIIYNAHGPVGGDRCNYASETQEGMVNGHAVT